MSTQVKVAALPACDLCKAHGCEPVQLAAYDGATTVGPWAYMCEDHFRVFGVGLGTGAGQRLVLS